MAADTSVFYQNLKDAASFSKKSEKEIFDILAWFGVTGIDCDYTDIKSGNYLRDIRINSIYHFIDFTEDGSTDEGKQIIRQAAELTSVIMFVPVIKDKELLRNMKSAPDEAQFLNSCIPVIKTAEALEELSVYAQSLGINAAVENFDSHESITERKAELEWLFSKAPHLKFNLDTGNSVFCGEDVWELFTAFRDRIVNVHCKDRRADLSVVPAGKGEMPISRITSALRKSGYTGNFSVEVFGVENPLDALESASMYLLREALSLK